MEFFSLKEFLFFKLFVGPLVYFTWLLQLEQADSRDWHSNTTSRKCPNSKTLHFFQLRRLENEMNCKSTFASYLIPCYLNWLSDYNYFHLHPISLNGKLCSRFYLIIFLSVITGASKLARFPYIQTKYFFGAIYPMCWIRRPSRRINFQQQSKCL